MATGNELINCPGDCGNQVHPRAVDCPYCGYRPESAQFEELLGSLSTVCSILTGFGLASLVTLATAEERTTQNPIVQWAFAVWIVGSVLLLVVMVLAKAIRRREIGLGNILVPRKEADRAWRRCERLLLTFGVALTTIAAGVVLFGFLFSMLHGFLGILASGVGVFLIYRTLR